MPERLFPELLGYEPDDPNRWGPRGGDWLARQIQQRREGRAKLQEEAAKGNVPADAPTAPAPTPPPLPTAPAAPTAPKAPRSVFDYADLGLMGGGGGAMPDYGPAPGAGGGGGGGGYGSRIASELMARKGQLSDLDPETQARLAKVKEAELMMLDKTMSEQSAQLLENMFGRGIQRSTIAGRVGEQLVASQGIARAGIESSAAQRYIGIQKDISDRAVAEAQVAVQDLSNLRQYKVGMAGVDAENRRTAASLKMAAMETSAKMAIAQGQLELGYGQLDLGYAGLDLDRDKFDWSQTQYWENLKRQDRSLDLQEKGLKNQSRSNWMGVLGGLGSSFLSILPFLSHPSFKAGLTPIEHEELAKALETVKDLPLYNFSYLGEADVHMGVNALEAHRLDDRLSNGLFVKPIDTIYVLVAAIKALTERVEELEHGR